MAFSVKNQQIVECCRVAHFYFAYNESHPLENGWEERIQICNLYPLLVHVNLFGGSYRNQVKNILSYYVG